MLKVNEKPNVPAAHFLHIALLTSVLSLTACNGLSGGGDSESVYGAIAGLDLSARFGGAAQKPGSQALGSAPRGVSYQGAQSGAASAATPITSTGEGYEIEFESAPIAAVAKSIIVDTLGLGLTVDPRVTGSVSLSSGRPLKRNELIVAFENALRASSAVLVKDTGGYRIIPATEAIGAASAERSNETAPGYGVSVMPLRYVSAETILKLVDGFAVKPGSVRVDRAQNVLLVQGSSDERRATMETVRAFDVDWMRGQSVGIYPVVNAQPDTMIGELQRILDSGESGAARGLMQFQSIARMNAILVVAKTSDGLRNAATWIRRLDRADNSAGLSRVYRVKYGNARQLAALLNEAFGGGAGRSTAESVEAGPSRIGMGQRNSGDQRGQQGAVFGSGELSASGDNARARGPSTAGSSDAAGAFGSLEIKSASTPSSDGESGGVQARGESRNESRIKITPDVSSNSLLIFADRERMRMVERVLQQLDRPRLQVAIEATIAEVSLNEGLQYGVQYLLRSGDLSKARSGSVGFTNLASPVLQRVLPGFNALLGPAGDPRAILDALNTRTKVKVLSTPSIVVLDNQVASIQVGDQVPVATSQATLVGTASTGLLSSPAFPVANNIDYRNTGVILRVLPRVSANGHVTLDVEQEISNVVKRDSGGTLTPTVSQRVVKSSVSVSSGQTVLLGGLISDRQTSDREGIPFLSNITYLGDLFSHNQSARDRTELVVFIQPRIIQDSVDAQSVAEDMRNKMLLSGGQRH